jgi:tetratricopeptide (TPR) repeat protein
VTNPGAIPRPAGSRPVTLGVLRRGSPAAQPSASLSSPAVLEGRSRATRRRLIVAGAALLALSAGAVLVRRTNRAPSARPAEAAAPTPAPLAADTPAAQPPAPAEATEQAPPPSVSSSAVSPAPDPADYGRVLSTGEALLKRGKYRAAVAQFRKAIELRPDSVPALLALGDAFLEGDQLRNAVKPLQQAAQLDPKNARAQLLLGTAFQGLGREKEAVAAYKRYLDLEPTGEFAGDVRAIVANLSK